MVFIFQFLIHFLQSSIGFQSLFQLISFLFQGFF